MLHLLFMDDLLLLLFGSCREGSQFYELLMLFNKVTRTKVTGANFVLLTSGIMRIRKLSSKDVSLINTWT